MGTGSGVADVPSGGSSALLPQGRARFRKEMGTFLISPLRGQKGTDLLQVSLLLLGNEECPHFFPGGRSSEAYGPARLQKWLRWDASRRPVLASSSPRSIRSQRESAAGRRTTRLSQSPLARHCGRRGASLDVGGQKHEVRTLRSSPPLGHMPRWLSDGNGAAGRDGGGVDCSLRERAWRAASERRPARSSSLVVLT